MIQERKSRKGAVAGLIFAAAVLLLVVLLENLSTFLGTSAVPSIFLPTSQLFSVLKKAAVYSLVAVSMNLLNGFTGLFSLGQAGFMMIGAYTYAILTIPVESRAAVYQYFDGGIVQFCLPMIVALILAGVVPMIFAWLIGLPVLKLKSDYLAIATLGFAEIMRAIIQWKQLGPLTNASNLLRGFAGFDSILFPFVVSAICIGFIVLLINSMFLICVWLCERFLTSNEGCKYVKYDNIDLIKPERYDELKADLEARLGLKITHIEVGAVDFLTDMTMLRVYYIDFENHVKSVDRQLKIPQD